MSDPETEIPIPETELPKSEVEVTGVEGGDRGVQPPCGSMRGAEAASNPLFTNNLNILNVHARDERIVFDEEPHLYYVDGVGGYTSVTTLVGKLFSHFNSDLVSQQCAAKAQRLQDPNYKYHGMTAEEIKAQWSEKGRLASEAGTEMHMHIEWFYNGHDVITKRPDADLTPELRYFKDYLRDYPHLRAYRTEWCVFDEALKLSGSIDMVYYNERTQTYCIYDWKRVSDIRGLQKDPTGKYRKFGTWPCSARVPDTKIGHYTLQLNTYKYILETNYGMKVTDLALVVLHPDNKGYEVIPLEDWSQTIIPDLIAFRQQVLAHGDRMPIEYVPSSQLKTLRTQPLLSPSDISLVWEDEVVGRAKEKRKRSEGEEEEEEEEEGSCGPENTGNNNKRKRGKWAVLNVNSDLDDLFN